MIGYYLIKKCDEKLRENASLILQKLSDPASLISFNASGALVDAAAGGMAGLAAFAKNYLKNNADALMMAAIAATPYGKQFMEAFETAMNMLALALLSLNNFGLKMLQEVAFNCMSELKKKDDKLLDMADKTKELYMVLKSLVGTSSVWDDYYLNLRQSLKLVAEVRADIKMVGSTFEKTDFWLAKKFDGTVVKLEKARDLITPKKNNPAVQKISEGSYKTQKALRTSKPDKTISGDNALAQTAKKTVLIGEGMIQMAQGAGLLFTGISDSFPFPTKEQQWQAMVAVGNISKELFDMMNGYAEQTLKCNALIASFKLGYDNLMSNVPNFLKKFVLKLLGKTYDRTDLLVQSMANTLNGSPTAISGPISNYTFQKTLSDDPNVKPQTMEFYKPNATVVTAQSFKWIMDINLILQGYKLIPTKQLSALSMQQELVALYKKIVKTIKEMNGEKRGLGSLRMKEGEEQLFDLEAQMTAFLIEANNAIISSSVRKEILTVARSMLARLELALYADHRIYVLLEQFYYAKADNQDELNQVFDGFMKSLNNAGCSRAIGAILSGDYATLFGLNATEASYVGRALAVLALLKACLQSKQDKDKASQLEADLKGDMDLLNINFSINFDLAIFKNLADCLNLNDLAKLFNLQELLCRIVQDVVSADTVTGAIGAVTNTFNKLGDLLSNGVDAIP